MRAGQRFLILVACGSFGFRRARLYTPRPRATAPPPLAVVKAWGAAGEKGGAWASWTGAAYFIGALPWETSMIMRVAR